MQILNIREEIAGRKRNWHGQLARKKFMLSRKTSLDFEVGGVERRRRN
jgi:hypothetical protein